MDPFDIAWLIATSGAVVIVGMICATTYLMNR